MKKNKLFSTISLILSGIMLVMSGFILVHSAQQQSAGTSLTVNFNGQNVNYEVQGWYHVSGGNRRELVDNDQDNDNIVTFSANEAPTEKTLKVSNTEANNKVTLTANNTYVLFTYKFVNTASSGAFGMEVSLSLTNVSGSNLKAVKYGTSDTLYIENQLSTFISTNVTSTTSFDDDFIVAGGTTLASSGTGVKYYYVLLEIDDVTLPVNFTPTFNWTVTCSDSMTAPAIGYEVTIKISNVYSGSCCTVFEIWDDWEDEIINQHAGLWTNAIETSPAKGNKLKDIYNENRDFTDEMQKVSNSGSLTDIKVISGTGKVLVLMKGGTDMIGKYLDSCNGGSSSHGNSFTSYYTGVAFTANQTGTHEIIFSEIHWVD